MPIGLPGHLGQQALNSAFSRAGHVIAFVCLISGFGIVSALQVVTPELLLWPALVALAPMAFVLWRLDHNHTQFYAIAYIAIGGASVYWYALTVMSQYQPLSGTDAFVLTMPKLALMFVGTPGVGVLSAIFSCIAAYAVAESATILAALQAGVAIVPDGTSLVVLGLLIAIFALAAVEPRSVMRAQQSVHRAHRDEQLAATRHRIEVKAAAVIHDTVLNHLAALATAPDGALNPDLRVAIERDLEFLVGEEWLAGRSAAVDLLARTSWQDSALFAAIEQSKRLGLEIEVSGDHGAVGRIGVEPSAALALAVKQCLVNVLKHSGTNRAEVVVYGSESDVSVIVVDSGRGFSESETSADRLGLRHSVRRRIEAVGGEVQVWSTLGQGTSVIISVPAPRVVEGPAALAGQ